MKKKDDLSSTFLWKKKLFVLNSFMKKKMICPELFYEKKDDLSLTFLWKKRWFVLNFFMKKKWFVLNFLIEKNLMKYSF